MTTALNLYATKVFSEQPIALWALDDTVDYIALVSTENQDLNNWTFSGGTVVNAKTSLSFSEDPPREPFENAFVNGVIESLGNGGVVSFTSPVALQPSDLNQDLGSFAIGAYFFTYDRVADVRMGYEYFDPEISETVEVIRNTTVPAERQWAFVSKTFKLPTSFEDLRFIIEVSFSSTATPYEFAVNAINIGQWAEEFHLESLGVFPENLPSGISLNSKAIPALPYGLEGANGYYLADDNELYAKNSGLPLVYGAFNSTVIFPNTNKPSLILPGFGFMNESGKYKNLTVEFWAKVQNNSLTSKRFFGPIASSDGLYVEGPFLKLKVGGQSASHFVGEWDRPMLFDLKMTPSQTTLILNGEEVLSIDINVTNTSFPSKFDDSEKDQDWLGFYAYEDVPIIQLDCVGIYPYEVAAILAKRRWVYGQAVETPNNIKGLSPSSSMYIDYAFANYAKNYSYPRMGRWRNGVVENLVPDAPQLSLPNYSLPKIIFNNQSNAQWYSDIEEEQGSSDFFISLKPNSSWDNTEGHILFESLNLLQDETRAFYGIFEPDPLITGTQVLFELKNENTGNSFVITLEDSVVRYIYKTKTPSGEIKQEVIYLFYVEDSKFLVGMDVNRFINHFGKGLLSFFGTKQSIKVFVGGSSSFENTFAGKIYRLGYSTSRNLSKISEYFSSRGVPANYENVFDLYEIPVEADGGDSETNFWTFELDGGDPYDFEYPDPNSHLASYTLIPKVELGSYSLDIGVDSYWEDYLPLSYFGKYVSDLSEKTFFALDFLQLNIDYPKFDRFSNSKYDTSGSIVKTYVTFQTIASGANRPVSSFTNTIGLDRGGIVKPGNEWVNTKYEVLDDTIIYPPVGVNFKSLSINIHIEISNPGIISNPIKIRSLKLSSQALGFSPNRIGTRFGAEIVPYRRVGKYFDYKSVNAFSIYKGSTPYLYNTSTSGIRLRGNFSTSESRGLSVPINNNLSTFFKVSSFQMALRYGEELFPETPVQIFEIKDKDKEIKFYLVSDSGSRKRGYIFAINGLTGQLETGITYNIDGRNVLRPVVNSSRWLMLGLAFQQPLDFAQSVGAFRITNPILINNLSYYQITPEDEAARFAYRKWFAVRSEPDNPLDWDYWDESIWQEVLFLTEEEPTVIDPGKIYKQYTGTDRAIIGSDSILRFGNYKYNTYQNLRWSRQTLDSA